MTFTEAQPEAPPAEPAPQRGCSPQAPGQQEPPGKPVLTSSPAIVVADLHGQVTALRGLELCPCPAPSQARGGAACLTHCHESAGDTANSPVWLLFRLFAVKPLLL